MTQGGGFKTNATRLTAAIRKQRAVELRLDGWNYADIARELGCSKQYVGKVLTAHLAATIDREKCDELRNIDLERLETMHRAVWPNAKAGDIEAINAVLKIMERRSKLCGLDQPTTTRIFIGDTDIDDAINRKLAIVAGGSETPLLPPVVRAGSGDPPGGADEAGPIVDSPPANGQTEIVPETDLP